MFNNSQKLIKKDEDKKLNIDLIVFSFLTLNVFVLLSVLYNNDSFIFQRFFGDLHPQIIIFLLAILGFIFIRYLTVKFKFSVIQNTDLRGLGLSFGLASIFGLIVIVVDILYPFPENTNILFPQSILFYPVMAYVAEILFHLLPLLCLLLIFSKIVKKPNNNLKIHFSILLVAFIDPLFQLFAGTTWEYSIWVSLIIFVHIFLVNFVELQIFKKYDFMTMYFFRVSYYFYWHILWGHLRVEYLF